MSDGNKFDATSVTYKRQQHRLPLDEMGNILLDAMQGALICLDKHHIIIDVSQTIKRHFRFEQTELIGLSILLLVEDSERDSFLKFLNSSQITDVCCVRMMLNYINEYRQVKVHRKKKSNPESVDVHSTTARSSASATETILVITLEDAAFIDITLHDIHKQEFYTKLNLLGEIVFQDHRVALVTGYLPNELNSHSIFDFVHHEDRLVKLHALWKCVTTGTSKLQWRLVARNGSYVFLQTEYKLIIDGTTNQEIIVARNELLSSTQRSQFDDLQAASRHQCTADIKGNNLSFKTISPLDNDSYSLTHGECRIIVPALNMCFTTNKLQPLHLVGNIFEGTRLTRPLTLKDYIHILTDKQKHIDHELSVIISNIESFTARSRRTNEAEKPSNESSGTHVERKDQSDISGIRSHETDPTASAVSRSSSDYKQTMLNDYSQSTLNRFLNGNGEFSLANNLGSLSQNHRSQMNSPSGDFSTQSTKLNQPVINSDGQSTHVDFMRKYMNAKRRFEMELAALRQNEMVQGTQTNDAWKRKQLLGKLSQLEVIKQRYFSRFQDDSRNQQTFLAAAKTVQQNDLSESVINSMNVSMHANMASSFPTVETNASLQPPLTSSFSSTNDPSLIGYYHTNYAQQPQRTSSSTQRSTVQSLDSNNFDPTNDLKSSFFEDLLTSPPSMVATPPINNASTVSIPSFMDVSFNGTNNDSFDPSSFQDDFQRPYNSTYPF